jgi:hypothetical protein
VCPWSPARVSCCCFRVPHVYVIAPVRGDLFTCTYSTVTSSVDNCSAGSFHIFTLGPSWPREQRHAPRRVLLRKSSRVLSLCWLLFGRHYLFDKPNITRLVAKIMASVRHPQSVSKAGRCAKRQLINKTAVRVGKPGPKCQPSTCRVCDVVCDSRTELRLHFKAEHPKQRMHACARQCGATFAQQFKLALHTCDSPICIDTTILCRLCHATVGDDDEHLPLVQHFKAVHSGHKPFVCAECAQELWHPRQGHACVPTARTTSEQQITSRQVHKNDPPYKCYKCHRECTAHLRLNARPVQVASGCRLPATHTRAYVREPHCC